MARTKKKPECRVNAWLWSCWIGLVLCCNITLAHAQDGLIGFIKTVQGDASLVVDGKAIKAAPGMPLQAGFIIKTGPDSSLGMTFRDNTVMSIGSNSELVVDQYLYSPGKGELRLWATISKGTLQYVSGVIAKLKPDAVAVRTPTGVIGVRGTRFLVMVEPDES
jgi:hypothetical protein